MTGRNISWNIIFYSICSFPASGGGPFSARIACARGRMAAPARFARLIAPAREAESRHTSPVRFSGTFRAGAKGGGERSAADAGSLLRIHPIMDFQESSFYRKKYSSNMTGGLSGRPGGLPARRTQPRRPATASIATFTPGTASSVPRRETLPVRAWLHPGQLYCEERSRGSSTSRSASPKRLKPNTESVIARPGNMATQGALSANSSAPPCSISPHAGVGSCTPRPR